MNAESNLITVPLSQLQLSPRNVRKTGGAAIEDLAASIAAYTLQQNLVVTRDAGSMYAVEAGGRRLKALQLLAREGKLTADWPVPCKVVPLEQAAEVSLAENQLREAMHPADQFTAIKALVDHGLDEGEVAARFGVTRLFVRQRMKLAKVSPKILTDYRAGKTTLEVVEACALSDDIPRQERSYKQAGSNANYLRQLLTKGEVPAADQRVQLIGLDVYEAAGGPVHKDMFDEANAGYVTDVKLLDTLVANKLEAEALKLRNEGWGWVEAALSIEEWRFPPHYEKKGDDKSKFGALVYCNYRGELQVLRWRMKPGQRAGKPAAKKVAKSKSAADLSQDMTWRLELHRAAAIREAVAASPASALRMLLADMLLHQFSSTGGHPLGDVDGGVSMDDKHKSDGRLARDKFEDLKASPARGALADRIAKWEGLMKAAGKKPTYEWLSSLTLEQQLELLALCFAMSIGRNAGASGSALADALGIDMSKWWTAAPETFLDLVPKAALVAAVADVGGPSAGELLLPLKKDAANARAAQVLAGTGWLPKPLRGKAYAVKSKAAGNASKASPATKESAKDAAPKRATTKKPARTTPKKPAAKKSAKKAATKSIARKGKR